MAVWYVRDGTGIGRSAVTAWSAAASKTAGNLIRPLVAPIVGNERVFIALNSGTTAGAEPSWGVTFGAKTTDNTITWQECTGQPGVNGDLTNCPAWLSIKNTAVVLGRIIKNAANTFLFICSTAGTAGNGAEPTWNTTAGQTTTDNTITWTCIGAVGNFTAWAAPHSRIGNAITTTWAAAGDSVYVAADHIESNASGTNNWNAGAAGNPILIACVPVTPVPPVSTTSGASATCGGGVTGQSFNICTTAGTQLYIVGVNIGAGGSFGSPINFGSAVANVAVTLEKCTVRALAAGGGSIAIGSINAPKQHYYKFDGCTFLQNNTGSNITFFYGIIEFANCSFWPTGPIPSTSSPSIFIVRTNFYKTLIKASDLGSLTTGIIALIGPNPLSIGNVTFRNCRLNPAITNYVSSGYFSGYAGARLKLQNCDNAATNYRNVNVQFSGVLQQSTSTYRQGGASDNTTALSWQIVNNANAGFLVPFECEEIIVWNSLVGSPRTASIYLTTATTLTNGDAWIELEYLGDSGSPLGTSDFSSKLAWFAAPVNLTTDASSIWTNGLGNNYVINVGFTPRLAGPVRARLYLAKPSVTVNVDLVLVIS